MPRSAQPGRATANNARGRLGGDRAGAGRSLPPDRTPRERRDGDHLPRHGHRSRPRRRPQAPPARIPARPRLLVALPPGGPVSRVAEPPERGDRLRLRRGPERPVHRHGTHRRRGPRDDPAPERDAAATPGRPGRHGRRAGARGGPCPGPGPSRHQARQRAHRQGRPGQGRRLRDRPGHLRGAGDPARDDPRLGPLLQPGAGAWRARDSRVGYLQPRHRPVRDARRLAAVGGRQCRLGRAGAPVRPHPGPDGRPSVGPAGSRGDRPARARARPQGPLAVCRGHGRCARGHAHTRRRSGCDRSGGGDGGCDRDRGGAGCRGGRRHSRDLGCRIDR